MNLYSIMKINSEELVSHLKMGDKLLFVPQDPTFRHIVSFLVCLIFTLEIVNVVCVNLNKNRVILLFEFG